MKSLPSLSATPRPIHEHLMYYNADYEQFPKPLRKNAGKHSLVGRSCTYRRRELAAQSEQTALHQTRSRLSAPYRTAQNTLHPGSSPLHLSIHHQFIIGAFIIQRSQILSVCLSAVPNSPPAFVLSVASGILLYSCPSIGRTKTVDLRVRIGRSHGTACVGQFHWLNRRRKKRNRPRSIVGCGLWLMIFKTDTAIVREK